MVNDQHGTQNLQAAAVGDQLRMSRLFRRLSQGEVAQQAGISQSLLSVIEKGDKTPDEVTLDRITIAIDSLSGTMSFGQVLRRIVYEVSRAPFPQPSGTVCYWEGKVEEGETLVFTSGDTKVEVSREIFEEDKAALREGHCFASGRVRMVTPDGVKDAHLLLRPYPDIDGLINGWRLFAGTKAAGLLLYLSEFLRNWWTIEGLQGGGLNETESEWR